MDYITCVYVFQAPYDMTAVFSPCQNSVAYQNMNCGYYCQIIVELQEGKSISTVTYCAHMLLFVNIRSNHTKSRHTHIWIMLFQ